MSEFCKHDVHESHYCGTCVNEFTSQQSQRIAELEQVTKDQAGIIARLNEMIDGMNKNCISLGLHESRMAEKDAEISELRMNKTMLSLANDCLKKDHVEQSRCLSKIDEALSTANAKLEELQSYKDGINKVIRGGEQELRDMIAAYESNREVMNKACVAANAKIEDQDNQLKAMALENIDANMGLVKAIKVLEFIAGHVTWVEQDHQQVLLTYGTCVDEARQFLATLKKDGE